GWVTLAVQRPIDGERAPVQLLRFAVVTLVVEQDAEVVECARRTVMLLAVQLELHGERTSVEPLRLGGLILFEDAVGQSPERGGDQVVLLTVELLGFLQ